jgi:hypothetical protein
MNVMTHTKTVKVHTLQINDFEVERFLDQPDELTDLLRDLLVSKPTTSESAAEEKTKHRRRPAAKVACPFCGRQISQRQIGNHENKCPQNPANATTD